MNESRIPPYKDFTAPRPYLDLKKRHETKEAGNRLGTG